jgi:glycopeptide antibiotics resistance protein
MKTNLIYSFLSDNSYLLPLGIVILTLTMLGLMLFPANLIGDHKIWSYDKIGHLVLFGSWTYILGLYQHINRNSATKLWVIFLAGIVFGLSIELLQHILPLNRHGNFGDLLFDTLGCLIAVGALKKTIPYK